MEPKKLHADLESLYCQLEILKRTHKANIKAAGPVFEDMFQAMLEELNDVLNDMTADEISDRF